MNWISRILPARAAGPASSEASGAVQRWQDAPEANLERSHYETRYVLVNIEASSLDRSAAQMLSVAAIGIDRGVIDLRDSYYAELGASPANALAGLLDFVGRQPVVMFNAGFHRLLVEGGFSRQFDFIPAWRYIDLYLLLPALFPDRFEKPVRLAEWMRTFGIETFQRHHALGDAWAIAQLFLAAQARALARGVVCARALIDYEQTHREYRRRG